MTIFCPAADAAIDQACRMLRLPTIRTEVPDLAEATARDQMSYKGFLAEPLMAECDDRSSVDPAVIHTSASCELVRKGLPLCLIGDSGTGKSHLLIALGTVAAMAGFRVRRLDQAFTDPRLCAAIVDHVTFGGNIIETGTDSSVSHRPARTHEPGK